MWSAASAQRCSYALEGIYICIYVFVYFTKNDVSTGFSTIGQTYRSPSVSVRILPPLLPVASRIRTCLNPDSTSLCAAATPDIPQPMIRIRQSAPAMLISVTVTLKLVLSEPLFFLLLFFFFFPYGVLLAVGRPEQLFCQSSHFKLHTVNCDH